MDSNKLYKIRKSQKIPDAQKLTVSLRNELLVNLYHYFFLHKLPIIDLIKLADMSRQRLYQILSNYAKEDQPRLKIEETTPPTLPLDTTADVSS